jgi:hypothetical protein
MMQALDVQDKLAILNSRKRLDLSLNDIRIIVGCLRAVAYQGEIDGEQYLDADALELKARLESLYCKGLVEHGVNGNSR